MNYLQQAAKQVLEAIDKALPYAPHRGEFDALADAAADLRAALAESQPEPRRETILDKWRASRALEVND